MTKAILFVSLLLTSSLCNAQLNPAITSFLQNTTITGNYYVAGNSTLQSNGLLVNCQMVEYSDDYVYIHATGVPAYPTGPYIIGPPATVEDQNAIFQIPLNPVENTGALVSTLPEYCGILINGVALWDFRDGFSWNSTTQTLDGPQGPGGGGGGGAVTASAWNRDAVLNEAGAFDCSKAHPGNGVYHHHQNPTAFKLDLDVLSTVCNLYDADGLYTIDSTQHSPLIGFAYDGFPIYGSYGYKNSDGTGGITRIKSGYQLRNITERTHHADGTDVADGPAISTTYPLGYFREDQEWLAHTGEDDYLDEHNGRFCVTPEYPNGIYCYFATVDENWNSAYPYAIGPEFYGVYADRKVNAVNETTTIYTPTTTGISEELFSNLNVTVFPNPSSDLIAVQVEGLSKEDLSVELYNMEGKLVQRSHIYSGATNTYLNTVTLYSGKYLVKVSGTNYSSTKQVLIAK